MVILLCIHSQKPTGEMLIELVDGLIRLMEGEHIGPINLGNLGEFTMIEHAETVKEDFLGRNYSDLYHFFILLYWSSKTRKGKGMATLQLDVCLFTVQEYCHALY